MGQLTNELLEKLKNDKRYCSLSVEYKSLLEDYAHYMDKEQYAIRTIQRGFYMIGKFLAFLQNLCVQQVSAASADMINLFLTTMAREPSRYNKPVSASFLADYFIHVKKLFRFLFDENRILVDPTFRMAPLPQKDETLPRGIMSIEEVKKVMDQPDTKTLTGIRDRAILELLYGSGLRSMEVRNLELDEINLKDGVIHIRNSKGAKDRVVPIGKTAAEWLERYLNLRRGIRPDLKEAFLSDIFNRPISESCFHAIVVRHVKKARVNKRVTPHSFRHTYATHLLQQGAPLRHIQALLGHSTLDSTQVYTHVADSDVKKAYSLAHPRDRLDPLLKTESLMVKQFIRKIGPRKSRKPRRKHK